MCVGDPSRTYLLQSVITTNLLPIAVDDKFVAHRLHLERTWKVSRGFGLCLSLKRT